MLISVITPVFNRADEIPHLLESMAKQTVASDRFEMVIVDDESTDETINIIESIEPDLNFNFNLVKQE
ncbi:MAG TPA: glycosyltransferase, partial [Candidatus Marinimicrobia bacterium]|nr:glycosyltransferase [Candidatus Neomarinimicrobiota bacterium]